mgnify:CR=1 FL=1
MIFIMKLYGLKPVLPRLARYGEILYDNFAILVGVDPPFNCQLTLTVKRRVKDPHEPL